MIELPYSKSRFLRGNEYFLLLWLGIGRNFDSHHLLLVFDFVSFDIILTFAKNTSGDFFKLLIWIFWIGYLQTTG